MTGETASSMFSGEETGIKSNRYSSKMKIINQGCIGHTPKVQDKGDKTAEKGWIVKKRDNALEAAIASEIVIEVVYAQMEAYSLN